MAIYLRKNNYNEYKVRTETPVLAIRTYNVFFRRVANPDCHISVIGANKSRKRQRTVLLNSKAAKNGFGPQMDTDLHG